MKKIAFISMSFLIIIFITCFELSSIQQSKSADYYEIIPIYRDDTLWEIAKKYSESERNIESYIEEIMEFNQISTTNIKAGQKIIIPIYKWEEQ